MTGTPGRGALVAAVAGWVFPSGTATGKVRDADDRCHHFDPEAARRPLAQLQDTTLTALADTVLGHPSEGARRLVGRLAAVYVNNALKAERGLARKGEPETSLREMGDAIAFADVMDAVLDAGVLADEDSADMSRLATVMRLGTDALGEGLANGWRASWTRIEWLHAPADELNEARLRLLVFMSEGGLTPSAELLDLVQSNWSRVGELCAVMAERRTDDAATIAAVLSSDSSALSVGAL